MCVVVSVESDGAGSWVYRVECMLMWTKYNHRTQDLCIRLLTEVVQPQFVEVGIFKICFQMREHGHRKVLYR